MAPWGGKRAETDSTIQLFTTKLNEQTKALDSVKEETRKLFDDRDKAFKFLAEKVKGVGDSIEKLGQGIPSNPALESAARDLPVLKAQTSGAINRLGAVERSVTEMSGNLAAILAKLEMIESMPASGQGAVQGGQGQPGRSGIGWGSRNIENQIEGICRDLVRALPKELQGSAEAALKKATEAFMNEFVKNFSQGLKPMKFPQHRQPGLAVTPSATD